MISQIRQYAVDCLTQEAEAVRELIPLLTDDFNKAVKLILECKGKFIITGVGKSGHIGAKIAATLASTGTPSFFVNPLDAYHGDLGMIETKDVVMAISYSGQTDELLRLIPSLKDRNIPLIAMTGNPDSLLARNAMCHLNIAVRKEACPLNLAPTSSTTATAALGDALACALMEMRNFRENDFARFHPGGTLGRKLLTHVSDVMRTDNLPFVSFDMKLSDVIIRISDGKLGLATVVDDANRIIGLITDGDVRRCMIKYGKDFFDIQAGDIMNHNPVTVDVDEMLANAEKIFMQKNMHVIIVTDKERRYLGILESYKCML